MPFFKRKNFTRLLCDHIGLQEWQLADFLIRGERNYTKHYIKNKQKTRIVFEPNETLRKMQIFAVQQVFKQFPVSNHSTAYEKQCSTLKNAQRHQNSLFLAHFDLQNFFQSLGFELFADLLKRKYDNQDIKILWLICSLNDGLPIGAYSSPFVANRVFFRFDKTVGREFRKVIYTRYADDLVFSSKKPLPPVLASFVSGELHKLKLELNHKKTYSFSEKSPKKVTGIVITQNKALTVGKKYKKHIKKQLYDLISKKKGNKAKVLGQLNYIKHIEPAYYKKLKQKYKI